MFENDLENILNSLETKEAREDVIRRVRHEPYYQKSCEPPFFEFPFNEMNVYAKSVNGFVVLPVLRPIVLTKIVDVLKKCGERKVASQMIDEAVEYCSRWKEFKLAGDLAQRYDLGEEAEKNYDAWTKQLIEADHYEPRVAKILKAAGMTKRANNLLIEKISSIEIDERGNLAFAITCAEELGDKEKIRKLSIKHGKRLAKKDNEKAAKYFEKGEDFKEAMRLYESICDYSSAKRMAKKLKLPNKIRAYSSLAHDWS